MKRHLADRLWGNVCLERTGGLPSPWRRRGTALGWVAGVLLLMAGPAEAAFVDATASRLPAASDLSYDVTVSDLDGDGAPDLIVADGRTVAVLVNDGGGAWADGSADRLPAVPEGAYVAVAAGDADGDGDPDLYVANAAGRDLLLINDGSGAFSDETGARTPAWSGRSTGAVFSDLDGDGDLDLVVACHGGPNRVLLNGGSGVFADGTPDRMPADSARTRGVAVLDADGDGAPDLFFANEDSPNRLLLNNRLGFFSEAPAGSLPAGLPGALDAVAADVDRDGDADLILAAGDGAVRLLLNDGAGIFSDGATRVPALADYAIRLEVLDFDVDGDPDLLVANAGPDRLLVNDGSGVFTDGTAAHLPGGDHRSFGAVAVDGEGDWDPDLVVAVPAAQNRLLRNDLPYPRLRVTLSPGYVEAGDTVVFRTEAYDEEGVASLSLAVNGVPVPLDASGTGSFQPASAGQYTAVVEAIDTQGNTGVFTLPFQVFPPDTQAPSVSLTLDAPSPLLVGHTVRLRVDASDDRRVVSVGLQVNGTDVPLDSRGEASYVVTAAGEHTVKATAVDAAGNEGSATASFVAGADTEPPTVFLSVTPDTVDLANPVEISAAATDNVAVSAFSVRLVGPPEPDGIDLILDADGNATYTPYVPGTYTVEARAQDPAGNETVETWAFEAVGEPDVTPPVVSVDISPRTVALGDSVTLTVQATDDVAVASVALEVNGIPLPLDASGSATYTPSGVGPYTAVATASDPTGNTSSVTETFRAVDPASDSTPPTAQITSPADDAEITGRVDIVGTASDASLVRYTLSYAPVGTADYVTFGTGDYDVVDGTLGVLDTSLLPGGYYTIRLVAEDINGATSEASIVVSVRTSMMLGAFTLSFQDKVVPIGAFPLVVNRNYDSRVKTKGDFGVGWTLGINEAVLQENRAAGESWEMQTLPGFIPTYVLIGTRPHTVEVRLSEKDVIRFRAKPSPETQQLLPIQWLDAMVYEPEKEGTGTLTAHDSPMMYVDGEIVGWDFDVYNPSGFTYTAPDGFQYEFTGSGPGSLRYRLTRITDPSGLSMTLTPEGVSRSDGKSLQFARDAQGRITSLTDPNGNVITYSYDTNGDLVAVTDPVGNETRYVYDANHNLQEVIDPLGRPLQKQEYDDEGRLIALTDASGERIAIEYDITANTQIVRDRRGNPTIYEYDSRGNVVRKTQFADVDEDGTPDPLVTTFSYDADGNLISKTNPDGTVVTQAFSTRGYLLSRTVDDGGLNLTTEFTYDVAGRVLTQTDARGNKTTNTYDANGRLLSRTDRAGNTTTYEYDGRGQLIRETDPLGNYTEYEYDAFGARIREEVFSATGVSLRKKTFTYDANGNKLSETIWVTRGGVLTPLTTRYEYDANDRVIRQTDPLGNVTRTEYDALGRVVAEVDPLGNRTEYEYDAACASGCGSDKPSRILYPDGTTTVYGYDPDGNRNYVEDRNGTPLTMEYDPLNRVVRVTYADGSSKESRWDAASHLAAEIDENGNRTDHEYDGAGRRVRTLQPAVYDALTGTTHRPETRYEYDANGNRTAVVDANGHRTEYVYDAEDRLIETRYPDGRKETVQYDALGRVVARTDPAGKTTTYEYDALGNLVAVKLPPPAPGLPAPVTTYTYDEAGNRIAQTDANGHTTRFEYDEVGRLVKKTLPEGQSETYEYDALGRVTRHVDFAGNETRYSYGFALDAGGAPLGRWKKAEYPDGSTVVTVLAGEGNRLKVTDGRGDTVYTYDERNRLVRVSHPDGTLVSYSYDAHGNQTAVTGPGGAVTYTYDALNRLASVRTPGGAVTSYAYDPVGNLVTVSRSSGVTTTYSYNARNQLTGVVHRGPDGTVLQSFAYSLDPNGLRTRVVEADGSVVEYTYDGNDRLIGEVRTGTAPYARGYAYDAVGNRTELDADGDGTTDVVYAYDANDRLVSAGATTYGYDANGNLVSETVGTDVTTYAYDPRNRLIRVVEPSGDTRTYGYDADGNRILRQDAGGTTRYLVDTLNVSGTPRVLEERDGAGSLLALYARGHGLAVQERGGTASFYLQDGLGSVRALTSAAGSLTDTYVYDGYGQTVAQTGSTPNPYRFAGEAVEPGLGLYYLRARYYDPATGRFLSMDPAAGDPQSPPSLHRYLYAWDNPVNFVDPTGKMTLVEVSISISINSNLQQIYTQNLMKFFFKAVQIVFCVIEPAYSMQSIGMSMMMAGLPGGEILFDLGRRLAVIGFQQIGSAIIEMYRNMASDMVKVEAKVSTAFDDYINAIRTGDVTPFLPEKIQKILEMKDKVLGYLQKFQETLTNIQIATSGANNCKRWKAITALAQPLMEKLTGNL